MVAKVGRLQTTFESNIGHGPGETRAPFFHGDNLFIVAEGLGEVGPQEMVEEMACQMISKSFFSHLSKSHSPRDSLLSAIEEVNGEIFNRREKVREELAVSVSVVFIEGNLMYFAHLGDSRIYAFHKGELTQLTRDQTITREVPHQNPAIQGPPPKRTFVLGLGVQERPEIRVKRFVLQKKDLIIMTTRGLTKRISNREILRLSSKTRSLGTLCNRLIDGAQRRGGNRNLTVGALKYARFTKNQKKMILAYSGLALLLLLVVIGTEALQSNREGGPAEQVQGLKTIKEDSAQEGTALVDQKVDGPVAPLAGDSPPSVEEAKPEEPVDINGEIRVFISDWKTAWENTARGKEGIEHYISFYSDDFHANGLDKGGWKRDKAEKGRNKAWIRLELKKIKIVELREDNRIEVRFLQQYKSSNYSGRFNKMLVIKREGREWKIITEKSG